jgi:RimJ/RimL family protein N-acetyltransferase
MSKSLTKLGSKLKISEDKLNMLTDGDYSLSPVTEEEDERKKFWKKVFWPKNFEYMALYADGKKRTEEEMEKRLKEMKEKMWPEDGLPKSLYFVSTYQGKLSGIISVGPLLEIPELGYVTLQKFAGKGVATANVKAVVRLLSFLVKEGKYEFKEIVAKCHPDNIGSARVLEKAGFHLFERIECPYGPRDRYRITVPVPDEVSENV